MKRKKIVFYTDCPFVAGCENTLLNILKFDKLSKTYDVVLIYRYSKRYREDIEKHELLNIKIHGIRLINFDNIIINLNYSKKKDLIIRIVILIIQILTLSKFVNLIKLYKVMKNQKPDIIHINNGGFPGADSCNLLSLISKKVSSKTIYTINNIPQVNNLNLISKIYFYFVSKNIDYFTTGSKFVSYQISKIFKNQVKNIPNCININLKNNNKIDSEIRKRVKDNSKIFISAGLLTKRKGFIELIEIFSSLDKEDFYLFIYGDGELRKEIQNKINAVGLSEKVFLMGYTNNLLKEIKNSDYFVLNSLFNEDMPYVLIEALLEQKPIISTDLAGINEIVIDGKNGYLSKPNNDQHFIENLNKAISLDETGYQNLRKSCKTHFEQNFDYIKNMNKYLNIYS